MPHSQGLNVDPGASAHEAASSRGAVQICSFQPLVDSQAGTWKSSLESISRLCLRGGGWTTGSQDSALRGCPQETGAERIERKTREEKSSVILPPGQASRKRDFPGPSYGGGG